MNTIRIPSAVLAGLLALTLVTAPATAADPAHTPAPQLAAGGDVQQLTLITGDTVRVSGPPGRQQVDVESAPRPDGTRPAVVITQHGADATVIPQDVAGLIPAHLDPRLFDVTELLAHGTSTPIVVTDRDGTRTSARMNRAAAARYVGALDTLAAGGARTSSGIDRIALDAPEPRTQPAVDEPTYELTIDAVARDGRPGNGTVEILDVDTGAVSATRVIPGSGSAPCTDAKWAQSSCVRVPAGNYAVLGFVYTMPPSVSSTVKTHTVLNSSLVGNPQLRVDADTHLTVDARTARVVHVATPGHPEATTNSGGAAQLGFTRTPSTGAGLTVRVANSPGTQLDEHFYEQPTTPVTSGELSTFTRLRLEQPMLTFAVTGKPALPLTPVYYDRAWFSDRITQFPLFDGKAKLRVVDIGTATPAEIAGRDLHGALALVRRSDAVPVGTQSGNAAEAGARFVAIYNDGPGQNPAPGVIGIRLSVPTVLLPHEQGVALLDRLRAHATTVKVVGRTASPYLYDLLVRRERAIPDDPSFVADPARLATVARTAAGQPGAQPTFSYVASAFLPGETASYSTIYPWIGGPRTRTDYYVPDPDVRWAEGVRTPTNAYNYLWPESKAEIDLTDVRTTTYQPGERRTERWLGAPLSSGIYERQPLQRADTRMRVHLNSFVDSSGHWGDGTTTGDGIATHMAMYAEDTLIAQTDSTPDTVVNVPAGEHEFRLVYDVDNDAPWANLSTHVSTEWTFRSAEPAPGVVRTEPVLVADYDLDADSRNVIGKGSGPVQLGVNVSHQVDAAQPAITGVTVDASYDDGVSWHRTPVRTTGGGHYLATITPRKGGPAYNFVSLRVHAIDADGTSLRQTITRAFAFSRFMDPRATR